MVRGFGIIKCFLVVAVVMAAFTQQVNAEFNTAYVCSFCAMVLGIVEESVSQIHMESYLLPKCEGHMGCELAIKELTKAIETKANPDDICHGMGVCPQECLLFNVSGWPVP